MEIVRERFLDDSRAHHLTLALRSRTTEAHTLLTALTPEERARVGDALVRALNEIEPLVRARMTDIVAR